MAENNPQFGNENAPNWTGASKGYTANTSGADLFKGVTDAIEMGVKAADTFFQNSFKDEARSSVDSVQDKYGAQPFVDTEGNKLLNNDPNAPPEARKQADKASKIQKSYANGELTESRYWAELDNISRQLRSRYPAYRDQIDTYMSHLTGAIPANRLIQEVRQEQMKVDKDVTKYETYVNHIAGKKEVGGLPADFFSRKAEGNPYTMDELRNHESNRMAMWYKVERAKAGFDLDSSQNKVDERTALESAGTAFSNNRYTLVENAAGGPTGYNKMIDTLTQAGKDQSGGMISKETESQLLATISMTRAKADAEFNKLLTQKDATGQSWDDRLNKFPEVKKKLREDHKAFWDDITESATNKQWGYLGSRLRYMEGRARDDRLEFENAGIIRAQRTMKDSLGPDALNWWLGRKGEAIIPSIDGAMMEFTRTNTLAKAGEAATRGQYDSKTNLGTSFDEMKTKGVQSPAAYKTVLDDHLKIITDPGTPDNLKKGALLSVYGPSNSGFLAKIDDKDRQATFMRMTSPQVTKSIKDTGDERLFQNYTKWATEGAYALNRTAADVIAQPSFQKNFSVIWNDTTKQFEANLRPDAHLIRASERIFPDQDPRGPGPRAYADQEIAKLNQSVKQLVPIWETTGDTTKGAQDFIALSGFPAVVPEKATTPSGKDNRRVGQSALSHLDGGAGADQLGDTMDPTVKKAGNIADAFSNTDKVNNDLWDNSLIDTLMTKAERNDPEEIAAIKAEFAPGSPVYGMYSMRLRDKLQREANQLDTKDPNMWTDAEAARYEVIQSKLIDLRGKEEDFFDAQRKGNHEAIIARQPSWTINGSKLRDIQRQYRQEFGIPEGLTIAKKFKDLGWQ